MRLEKFNYVDACETGLKPGKVVCVGRNYLEHIQELNNEPADEAVLFIKPSTALVHCEGKIELPADKGAVHHELELSLLIGDRLCYATLPQCFEAIAGYGLALDLTLRELQTRVKNKGLPWERAKAFDASCPITPFVRCDKDFQEQHEFSMLVNGKLRQSGDTKLMIRSMANLLAEISRWFTLEPGDVVLTGTPAGVAELKEGDELQLTLDNTHYWQTKVQIGLMK